MTGTSIFNRKVRGSSKVLECVSSGVGQANMTLDELAIKMVKRAEMHGAMQIEARTAVRGPAVQINGETYYSSELWPYLGKQVYFYTRDGFQDFIRLYIRKNNKHYFLCRAETRERIKALVFKSLQAFDKAVCKSSYLSSHTCPLSILLSGADLARGQK